MEEFDLYDKHGNRLNKTMHRGGSNQPGEYHLVSHIWFRNSQNQYLVQQRNKIDDEVPYQWACTGGAILKGETSKQGTLREIKEELGIDLHEDDLILLNRYVVDDPRSNYLTDLYLVEKDIPLQTLVLDETEVKDAAYKSMQEIKEMISNDEFWNYERFPGRYGYFEILEMSNKK